MQLVTVNPDYAGRSRVMISNLEQSGDFEAACHNAFEKSAKQMDDQADAYLKSGNFGTTVRVRARAEPGPRFQSDAARSGRRENRAGGSCCWRPDPPRRTAAYTALHGPQAAEGSRTCSRSRNTRTIRRAVCFRAPSSPTAKARERGWNSGRLEPDAAKAATRI